MCDKRNPGKESASPAPGGWNSTGWGLESGGEGTRPRGEQQEGKNTSRETRQAPSQRDPPRSGSRQIPLPPRAPAPWSVSPPGTRSHPQRAPPGGNGRGRRRPAPGAQGAPAGRWLTRNFRACASSSGERGAASPRPRRAARGGTAERTGPGARGGCSGKRRPARAGAQASRAQRKQRGRILHLLPRPRPARPDARYGAGLRRFMPRRPVLDPAAAAPSAAAPAVAQAEGGT